MAGDGFTFLSANADNSACVYGAVPGIALAWRTSDLVGYEGSRQGAESVGGIVNDASACDTAFWIDLGGGGILMEAFSAAQGRAYNATITGFETDLDTFVSLGAELLESAC